MKSKKQKSLIKLAIQGVSGSYSWAAAKKLAQKHGLKKIKFFYCSSFEEVFALLNQQKIDYAVLPYRNSIAGKVEPVWSNLKNYQILDRLSLPINHCLAVIKTNPPLRIQQIKYAFSHPVALKQCQKFFQKHPWIKPKEYEDTAAAAQFVSQSKKKEYAAICSEAAASLFGLVPLLQEIQDKKSNRTFFVLIR